MRGFLRAAARAEIGQLPIQTFRTTAKSGEMPVRLVRPETSLSSEQLGLVPNERRKPETYLWQGITGQRSTPPVFCAILCDKRTGDCAVSKSGDYLVRTTRAPKPSGRSTVTVRTPAEPRQ